MADSLVIDTQRPEKFWISYIKGRIKKKKNFLGVCTGPTGSGKSWASLSICHQADPTFHPGRIVFSMEQLMKLVNEGNLKSGQAILWDEAGIDIGNRSWQSLINKLVNFLLQTFRHKRLIVIMTVPYIDFVDAGTRKLFHAEFLTQKIDYEKKICKIKAQLIQYNSRNRKFYYKYLRVRGKTGVVPIRSWLVDAPPAWLVEEYEVLKRKFTDKLNIDIERQLNQQKNKEKAPELTETQSQAFELMCKYRNVDKVAEDLNLSPKTIYFHLQQARKKGYDVENVKNNTVNSGKTVMGGS